jgi:hypothetical protein
VPERNRLNDLFLGGFIGLVLAFIAYSNDYAPFRAKSCDCRCVPDGNVVNPFNPNPSPWNRPYKPNGSTGTVGESK